MTQVLIFVPGLMGSELWDNKGKLWPGNARDWAFGYGADKFTRLLSDDLETPDIVRSAVGVVDIYEKWIDAFEALRDSDTNLSLFTEGGAKPTLLVAPYDWRKSINIGAVAVADAVERAINLHGDEVEIHLVAHSMGGLVSRYYFQSGAFDETSGFGRIVSFITFGTPHKGAVVALAGALGQHKANFLSLEQSSQLANDQRFQGLYNLFPQPGARPVWERVAKARLKARDVFDAEVAGNLKLNAQSLADTHKIFEAFANPWPNIRTFLFVGTRFETMTHVLWDGLTPIVVRTRDGGDGTVNLQGAMLENQQIRLTDKNHVGLIAAPEARDALQELFNAYGVLLAENALVSLTPAEHFFESEQPIEVALAITGPGAAVHGKLYLERARIDPGADELGMGDFVGAKPEGSRELRYDGPDLTMLNVKFDGVVGPAAFRPVFETYDTPSRRFEGPVFLVTAPG